MKTQTILCTAAAAFFLGGCGGGDSESSGSSSSPTSSTSSSSGGACNYADKISASERARANACGVQVSALYAQADSLLKEVIATCQQGQKASADAYYSSTYTQSVNYARSSAAALSCSTTSSSSTSTAPTLANNTPASYYNFCVNQVAVGGRLTYTGVCSGPYQQFAGTCPSGYSNNVAQYSSQSACMTAGQAWLNSH